MATIDEEQNKTIDDEDVFADWAIRLTEPVKRTHGLVNNFTPNGDVKSSEDVGETSTKRTKVSNKKSLVNQPNDVNAKSFQSKEKQRLSEVPIRELRKRVVADAKKPSVVNKYLPSKSRSSINAGAEAVVCNPPAFVYDQSLIFTVPNLSQVKEEIVSVDDNLEVHPLPRNANRSDSDHDRRTEKLTKSSSNDANVERDFSKVINSSDENNGNDKTVKRAKYVRKSCRRKSTNSVPKKKNDVNAVESIVSKTPITRSSNRGLNVKATKEPAKRATRQESLKNKQLTVSKKAESQVVNEDRRQKLQSDAETSIKNRLRNSVLRRPSSNSGEVGTKLRVARKDVEQEVAGDDVSVAKEREDNLKKALETCCDWFLPILCAKPANVPPQNKVLVFDNKSPNREIYKDCIFRREFYDFELKNGSDPFKILAIAKPINHESFSMGFLILDGKAEKGMRFVNNDTIVYWVRRGTVEVTINDHKTLLNTTDSFLVPAGNAYNIVNLTNVAAEFVFFQLKN